jgi:hypothetical protein
LILGKNITDVCQSGHLDEPVCTTAINPAKDTALERLYSAHVTDDHDRTTPWASLFGSPTQHRNSYANALKLIALLEPI